MRLSDRNNDPIECITKQTDLTIYHSSKHEVCKPVIHSICACQPKFDFENIINTPTQNVHNN